MTFEEFKNNYYHVILPKKPPFLRKGQALFNYLAMTWPLEADRIVEFAMKTGKMSKLDCFGNDGNIENLLDHLESSWENYPK